jgi:hypothetical protein
VHFCAAHLRRAAPTCTSPGSSTARHRSQPQQVIAATYAGQDVGERAGLTADERIVARARRDRGLTCGPRVKVQTTSNGLETSGGISLEQSWDEQTCL